MKQLFYSVRQERMNLLLIFVEGFTKVNNFYFVHK